MKTALNQLHNTYYDFKLPLTAWQITSSVNESKGAVFGGGPTIWRELESAWGKVKGTYWIKTRVTLPDDLDNKAVYLDLKMHSDYPVQHVRVPWAVGLTQHFEGLVYVDGKAYHGLDPNRSEVMLTSKGKAGTVYEIVIEAYSSSVAPKFFQAFMFSRNEDVHRLYYDCLSLRELVLAFEKVQDTSDVLQAAGGKSAGEQALDLPGEVYSALAELSQDVVSAIGSGAAAPCEISQTISRRLEGISSSYGQERLELLGHCHIDTAWLWRIAETRRKAGRTFSTHLRYLEEFPTLTYLQSAPVIYEFCREDYPEIYDEIKEQAAEGRWLPEGAMYVEADCNMPSGESLVRQILLGKEFFQNEFGIDSRILWLPDVFGFSGNLPQLMKQAGIKLFYNTKVGWFKGEKNPFCNYWWEGIDGTRVMGHFEAGYINWASGGQVLNRINGNRAKQTIPHYVIPFGFGDGGGGATKEDLEVVKRWENLNFFPCLEFTTSDKLLASLEEEFAAKPEAVPVLTGEQYLEFHRGTYTSVAMIKLLNRQCESALHNAELLSALSLVHAGAAYPTSQLRMAWKRTLLNQFHDILPGSSIKDVYLDAAKDGATSLEICERVVQEALQAMKKTGQPGVFNLFSHPVSGLLKVPEGFSGPDGQSMVDVCGNLIRYAWVKDVPAWGCCHYVPAKITKEAFCWDGSRLNTPFWEADFALTADTAEKAGSILRLYDKVARRQVEAGALNEFQVFEDFPGDCEPWELMAKSLERQVSIFHHATLEVIAEGPIMFVLRRKLIGDRSTIFQDIRFFSTSARIDFVTRVDWHERRKLLKAAFALNIASDTSRAETVFGLHERPMARNTPAEKAMFETSMHRWIDFSEPGYGVSLLNDSKYGYDGRDQTLRLTLLKSPGFAQLNLSPGQTNPLKSLDVPEAWADQGEHCFTYSLLPHGDSLGDTIREANLLNNPLLFLEDGIELNESVKTDQSNIVIDTMKAAEEGGSLVLRFYETEGQETQAQIRLGFPFRRWAEADILERETSEYSDQPEINLQFRRFEVRTLKVELI